MTCKKTWPGAKLDPKKSVQVILDHQKIDKEEYRFGKTKIFIRNPTTLFSLEDKREADLPWIVTKIQTCWRRYACRKKWIERKAAIKIQSNWKGYVCRKNYQKAKASILIMLHYKAFKSRRWLLNIKKAFADNMTPDKNYGKGVEWPKPTKVLITADLLLHKIHTTWRAYKMINALKPDEQAEMRQKILALDIFRGKKPWNCARRFEADYLELDSNPGKDKYVAGMEKLFATFNDSQVLFADYVDKINHKNKVDRRAIVVTDSHVYKQDPKNYKVKKFETPLVDITSISMSTHEDTFVVVHAKEPRRDILIDLGISGTEKCSEFVSAVVGQIEKISDNNVQVNFMDSIKYNNGRTPKSPGVNCLLTFQAATDPKVKGAMFKSGKSGNNVILYNSSSRE